MKYDVIYAEHHAYVEPHYCREWDGDRGCYGTNEDHGFTWEEARKYVVEYHMTEATRWGQEEEPTYEEDEG